MDDTPDAKKEYPQNYVDPEILRDRVALVQIDSQRWNKKSYDYF